MASYIWFWKHHKKRLLAALNSKKNYCAVEISPKILIAFPNKNLLNKQLQVKNHNLKRELYIENWNRKKIGFYIK
jgi:hypothetical protein